MEFKYGKDHLTAGKALQILRGELTAVIDVDSRKAIDDCHQVVLGINESEKPVYGINTGFGPLFGTIISKDKTSELQKNLLLSHSVGMGNPIDIEIAKLMLILKVHALAQAFSGISLEVIDRIIWHIDHDIIPVVPEQGSVGASGDLAPLSHLFIPLIGEGFVFEDGIKKASSSVLSAHGLEPLALHPKAGLCLINGTQFISAHTVFIIEKLHNCLAHADMISAMMIESLNGSRSPFDKRLHATRPYPANQHVANRMMKFLGPSEIKTASLPFEKVQDPYSMRCIPQVHGASRTAWLHLKEALEIELNSVTDNPIIYPDGISISGGNFHGQPLAMPIDYVCLAASELGNISDRRSYFALEGKTYKLPKLLMENTGLNSGFMIVQYTGAAIASENKTLCFPASADSIPTSLGQEDHVSMGSIGARKALRVVENLEKILAVELLCSAQALEFFRPLKSNSYIEAFHKFVRTKISFATEDRNFSLDLEKAVKLIQSKEMITIASKIDGDDSIETNQLFETF